MNSEILSILNKIADAKVDLYSIINREEFNLYWNLGKVLATHSNSLDDNSDSNSQILALVTWLYPLENELFTTERLADSLTFYKFFPDSSNITELGSLYKWNEIVFALRDKSNCVKLVYWMVEKYEMIVDTNEDININILFQYESEYKNPGHWSSTKNVLNRIHSKFLDIYFTESRQSHMLQAVPEIGMISLARRQGIERILLQKNSNSDEFQSLKTDIFNTIDRCITTMNNQLNFAINRNYWYLGVEIFKVYSKKLDYNKQDFFHTLVEAFRVKAGPYFNHTFIEALYFYAEQYQSFIPATRMALVLTWDHINVLVKAGGTFLHSYMTEQIVERNLSVPQLIKLLSSLNLDDFQKMASEEQPKSIYRGKIVETNGENSNQKIIESYSLDIDDDQDKSLVIQNIFESVHSPLINILLFRSL